MHVLGAGVNPNGIFDVVAIREWVDLERSLLLAERRLHRLARVFLCAHIVGRSRVAEDCGSAP